MFKKNDYIIISVICFFLGIFIIIQFFSSKEYKKVVQPENNDVLALEVAKLTKSNADLRREVVDLTNDMETYRSSTESRKSSYNKFTSDSERLDIINGVKPKSGQGITIYVNGTLATAQIVDLINAIKNIGAEVMSINGTRIVINSNLSNFSGVKKYEINVLGNSELLKTSMERKGGIVEQISNKDIVITIQQKDNIEIPGGTPTNLIFAKIIEE